jgi:hypothetical protein
LGGGGRFFDEVSEYFALKGICFKALAGVSTEYVKFIYYECFLTLALTLLTYVYMTTLVF